MRRRPLEFYAFLAFALFVLAAMFHRFGEIPFGLFQDETAIGYDAESILHTAADSYGTFLPLNFRSLDDYKSPIAVYVTVPIVALFGPTRIGTRLPCALFLIGAAVALYFLIRRLTGREPLARWLSALFLLFPSVFFYAHLSPFSEGDSCVLTFVLALLTLERFGRLPGPKSAALAGAAIGFYTYSYTTARLGAPLLLGVASVVFFVEKSHRRHLPWLIGAAALVALPEAYYMHVHPGTLTARFDSVSVFGRSATKSLALRRMLESYLVYLGSFDYFFRTGQHNDWHNAGMGFFPVWMFVFWALGFVVLWRRRAEPMAKLILVAWFLSPIPAIFTYDVIPSFPHTTRALLAAPIGALFAAVALSEVLSRVELTKPLLVAAVVFVGLETVQDLHQYFDEYGQRWEGQGGFDWGTSAVLDLTRSVRKPNQPLYLGPGLYDNDALGIAYSFNLPVDDYRQHHFERENIFKTSDRSAPSGSILVLEGRDPPTVPFEEIGRIKRPKAIDPSPLGSHYDSNLETPFYIVYRAL